MGVVPLHLGVVFSREALDARIRAGVVPLHLGVVFSLLGK